MNIKEAIAYTEETKSLSKRLGNKIKERQENRNNLLAEISWFEKFDKEAEIKDLEKKKKRIEDKEREIQRLTSEMETSKKKQEEGKIAYKQIPFYRIKEKFVAARSLWKGKRTIDKFKSLLKECNSIIIKLNDVANKTGARIRQFESFDKGRVQERIDAIDRDLESSKISKQNLDGKLESILDVYKSFFDTLCQIKKIRGDIERLKRYQDALDQSETKYEKAQIHQQCEEEFGNGKPNKLRNELRHKKERLEDDYKKIEERFISLVQKMKTLQQIKTLIIDGNNFCYRNHGNWIGLWAMILLLKELRARKYKIVIVFDEWISRQLGMSPAQIKRKIGDDVEIQIAPPGTKADDLILTYAEKDDCSYILSNDRFADYPEKKAVREGRLLRHLISADNIVIDGLDINIPLPPQPSSMGEILSFYGEIT